MVGASCVGGTWDGLDFRKLGVGGHQHEDVANNRDGQLPSRGQMTLPPSASPIPQLHPERGPGNRSRRIFDAVTEQGSSAVGKARATYWPRHVAAWGSCGGHPPSTAHHEASSGYDRACLGGREGLGVLLVWVAVRCWGWGRCTGLEGGQMEVWMGVGWSWDGWAALVKWTNELASRWRCSAGWDMGACTGIRADRSAPKLQSDRHARPAPPPEAGLQETDYTRSIQSGLGAHPGNARRWRPPRFVPAS